MLLGIMVSSVNSISAEAIEIMCKRCNGNGGFLWKHLLKFERWRCKNLLEYWLENVMEMGMCSINLKDRMKIFACVKLCWFKNVHPNRAAMKERMEESAEILIVAMGLYEAWLDICRNKWNIGE